jgi:hypothetical protein
MEKGVSAEFPGIQLNPPHLDRGLCVSLAINREGGKYQQTKKTKTKWGNISKGPERSSNVQKFKAQNQSHFKLWINTDGYIHSKIPMQIAVQCCRCFDAQNEDL